MVRKDFKLTVLRCTIFLSLFLISKQLTYANDIPSNFSKSRIALGNKSSPISTIPNELFRNKELERLSLYAAPLDFPMQLGSLPKFKRLELEGDFDSLSPTIENINQLERLDISVGLKEVPDELGKLLNLIELRLPSNRLNSLPNQMQNLQRLEGIDIAENEFVQFPTVITKIINLSWLSANNNRIKEIPSRFGDLKNLKGLNLKSNELQEIPNSLGEIQTITDINLMDNRFRKWPEVLGELRNLKEVNLSHNRIETLFESTEKLGSLTKLWLHSNSISEIPDSIRGLKSLQYLYLWNNRIQSISPEIQNLTELKILHLKQNDLISLPTEIGSLRNLAVLELSSNQLRVLPISLGNLTSLKGLFLGFNQLKELPPSLGKLGNLQELDLSFNELESLPSDLRGLKRLKTLNLFGNSIRTIPDSLGSLTDMYELSLGGNELTSIPASIGNLKKLNILDLSDNKIELLPNELGKLTNLEYLSLRNNQIQDFPDSLKGLRSLKTIHVDGNPLKPEALAKLKRLLPSTVIIHWQLASPNERLSVMYRKTFEKLNRFRVGHGAIPMEMDFRLCMASEAHARYLIANEGHPSTKGLGAHDEKEGLPLFTPEGSKKEFRYGTQAEVISFGDETGDNAIDTWHQTILHRRPITSLGYMKMGFGFAESENRKSQKAVLRLVGLNHQYLNVVQNIAPDVSVYPYENMKGVPLTMRNELPNTTPLEDDDQIVGYPIAIKFYQERSYDLQEFKAKLMNGSGKMVPHWLIQPSDRKYGIGGETEIWIMSQDPLEPNETYTVEAEGIRRGKRFWSKKWSFTTVK